MTHTVADNHRVFYDKVATEFAIQRLETGEDDLERGKPPLAPKNKSSTNSSNIHMSALLLGRAWELRLSGKYFKSLQYGFDCFRYRPFHSPTIKSLLVLVLKPNATTKQ